MNGGEELGGGEDSSVPVIPRGGMRRTDRQTHGGDHKGPLGP